MTNPAPQLFISYSRQDPLGIEWAERLRARLEAWGFPCWQDELDILPGEPWPEAIPASICASGHLLSLQTRSSAQSHWMREELTCALNHAIPVIPLLAEPGLAPLSGTTSLQQLDLTQTTPDPWAHLLARLTRTNTPHRRLELAYLDQLIHRRGFLRDEPLYTPLAGDAQPLSGLHRVLSTESMPVEFALAHDLLGEDAYHRHEEPERFDDILDALRLAPRMALLGEPGAGKTFALRRIAVEYARTALHDPEAPLPLFVPLKQWLDLATPLDTFIAHHAERLARQWPRLLEAERLVLLLDGLNELPTALRTAQMQAIRCLAEDPRLPVVVVSCRRNDFTGVLALPLAPLDIQPLDPKRIRAFIHRYSQRMNPARGSARGERLFWQLAGDERLAEVWTTWEAAGARFDQFWTTRQLEEELPHVYKSTTGEQDRLWREACDNPRSLLHLAANPYLLALILHIADGGRHDLPRNRASLFRVFVQLQIEREQALHRDVNEGAEHPGFAGLEAALGRLAWRLQQQAGGPQNVQLALPVDAVSDLLTPAQCNLAEAAHLLEADETVRFSHQLLQEYCTALGMRSALLDGTLRKQQLWPPERWWEPSGWEEATLFMAAMEPDNPLPWLDWLADAHPGLLLDCLKRSGCRLPSSDELSSLGLVERWQPRLDPDSEHWETAPEGRQLIALALGHFGLDARPGVGLRPDGLPDIDWVAIPAGEFLYGEENLRMTLPGFHIARYPVTNAQFHAFIDAGGYAEERWWQGLDEHPESPAEAGWSEPNRPRERVSWYEAVAFCRWLSAELGYEVRLPSEQKWERAARGTGGREYPWGDGYRSGHANINETWGEAGKHHLNATSVVGLYPQGASNEGVLDLAGNLWEWCLNGYEQPERTALSGTQSRVLRGGSWNDYAGLARAADRDGYSPVLRDYDVGFRVLCVSPIHSDH